MLILWVKLLCKMMMMIKKYEVIYVPLEYDVPNINAREQLKFQRITGKPSIDFLFCIGDGQRMVMTGPTKTGKTLCAKEIIENRAFK